MTYCILYPTPGKFQGGVLLEAMGNFRRAGAWGFGVNKFKGVGQSIFPSILRGWAFWVEFQEGRGYFPWKFQGGCAF